ncbi:MULTISPECIES: hypothetical protein [unclassified Halomonas]|uniref:hypothetical protein n=1 Tax=unclassified Halomonas TaxID=2609666 RepID=UPI00207677C7|nr:MULTISPECIES: hypothetical protein [unclassified Halomonas]
MKPIEPGCLVVVLRGNLANNVAVAVERVPAQQGIERHPDRMQHLPSTWRFNCDAWEIEMASDPECAWVVAENNLMRIDGGDANADATKQQREVTDA